MNWSNAFISSCSTYSVRLVTAPKSWTPRENLSERSSLRAFSVARNLSHRRVTRAQITSRAQQQSPDVSESNNGSEYTYFATCARGLGEVLADEIRSPHINAEVLHVAASGVSFRSTEKNHMIAYKSCLWLRTATRVLHHLFTSAIEAPEPSSIPDAVYSVVKQSVDWPHILSAGHKSFSIQVRMSYNDSLNISEHIIQICSKDAICDNLRDAQCDKPPRPESHGTADVPLFLTLNNGSVSLYRDMAGASLHKRGYRSNATLHRGSLNEAAAAGMLYLAGLEPDGTFTSRHGVSEEMKIVDPMCGSGTLLIEAALLRLQVAVGLYRNEAFPFEHWSDFDQDGYNCVRQTAIAAQKSEDDDRKTSLIGSDIHGAALALAERDVARTRLSDMIELRQTDIKQLSLRDSPELVICNPPWGRRLDEGDAWYDIGQFLRHEAPDSTAVLLSGDANITRGLRMKARNRYPVRIGNVDTRVLVYDVLPKLKQKDQQSASVKTT